MTPTSGGTEAGFTLLEALAAFAIVAALMAGILTLFSDTGLTANRAEQTAATVEAARSAIVRMGPEIPLAPGATSWSDGPIDIRVEVSPGDTPGLWHVDAIAVWDDAQTRLETLKVADSDGS